MAKGKVQIDLVAKDEASEKIKKVAGHSFDLKTTFLAVAAAAVAMAGAVTAAVGKMLNDWATFGDDVAKMAKRTQWSVESLSELAYAAKIAGMDLAQFELGTRKLSGAIYDASMGMVTYTRAFDELGLNADDLLKMGIEDQFWAVAYAMAELDNDAVRAALAVDLFGRTGTNLLPLLAEGKEGIAKLRQESHDFGISLTEEDAKAAEEFKDALTRIEGAVDGVQFALVTELAPAITDLINQEILPAIQGFKDWVKENDDVLGSLTYLIVAAGHVAVAIGNILANLIKIGEWFGQHKGLWDALGTILPGGKLVFWPEEMQQGLFGSGGPGLVPGIEEAYGAQASAMLSGSSINITINGNVMGDESATRQIAQSLEPYLGEASRTTSFPHVNTSGYFGGNSAR